MVNNTEEHENIPDEAIFVGNPNEFLAKTNFEWPNITKEYIIKLINYMKKIMYI